MPAWGLRWGIVVLCGLVLVGSACDAPPPPPVPGAAAWASPALVTVPGGVVSVAGGNLLVRRVDFTLDTRLGTQVVGAAWNSADRAWQWSFELHYDGVRFVDESGARHGVASLGDGAPIPGTPWTRLDATRIATRGGLVYRFDPASGRLAAIRRQSAALPELRFVAETDAGGTPRLDRVEQCGAAGCALAYDVTYDAPAGRRVAALRDRAGREARFAWNADGTLAAARDPLDVARDAPGFRYAWADGLLAAVTNSEGERVDYGWQADASTGTRRLASAALAAAGAPAWRFAYLGASNGIFRTQLTDPLGAVTQWRWDAERRVVERTAPTGERSTLAWQGRRPVRETGPDGATTAWTWSDDRLATATAPSGNTVRFTWAPGGENRLDPLAPPLARAEDDLGPIEQRAYDAQGRLIAIENGAGERSRLAYDADGELASFTDPAGVVTTVADYGEHGHPTQIGVAGNPVALGYDAVGNLVSGPDLRSETAPGRGGIVARHHDEDRNVHRLELADLGLWFPTRTAELVIEHRSDGRPLRLRRPGGGDVEWSYDAAGRLVSRRERSGGAWHETRFERDAAGRTTAIERPNGTRQAWRYDGAGRVVVQQDFRDGALESSAGFVWRNGRLDWSVDPPGVEQLAYDAAGRPREVIHPGGERTRLAWDPRSRLVELELRDEAGALVRRIGLAYDAAGRERAVLDGGVPLVERSWRDGRPEWTRTANGLLRTFAYDAATGELAGTTLERADGTLVERTTVLPFDPLCLFAARCASATTEGFGALAATSQEKHWLMPAPPYAEGRRVGATLRGGAPSELFYDVLGNVTQRSGIGSFEYDAEGLRLLRAPGVGGYAYDEAGHAVARGGDAIAWDAAGRVAAVGPDRFAWDARGRPVSERVDGAETRFRFGGRVAADPAGRPLALDLGEVRLDLSGGGGTLYRHFDARGNPKLVSDERGEAIAHLAWDAYGLAERHGSDVDDLDFARGRAVRGLVRIGHRLYDPLAGRFLAPDPVFQVINPYAYAQGNPLLLWDPSGRDPIALDLAAAAAYYAGGTVGGIAGASAGSVFGPPGGVVGGAVGAHVFSQAARLFVIQAVTGQRGGRFQLLPGGAIPPGAGASSTAAAAVVAPAPFADHVGPTEPCGGDACPVGGGGGGSAGGGGGPAGEGGGASQGAGGGPVGCAPALPAGTIGVDTVLGLFALNAVLAGAVVAQGRRRR